jgi:hypothetical protein
MERGPLATSRASRAARAACEPALLGSPWREAMVLRKSSEACSVLVPQSNVFGRGGSLAAAKRPSEVRRKGTNMGSVAKGDEECKKQSLKKPCGGLLLAETNVLIVI